MALTERQTARKLWLQKAISEIQYAQINGFKSEAVSMSFNGRSITRFNMQELENMRFRFDQELTKLEKIEAGTFTRTIRVWG